MAAQVEEILMQADPVPAEKLRPDFLQTLLASQPTMPEATKAA